MTNVVYLHGFLSSPQSEKAQATRAYVAKNFPNVTLHVPQIPNTIDEVEGFLLPIVKPIVEAGEPLKLIGSSMGGFLSTWLVEQFGGKAVLVNPAVEPYKLMQDYMGEHQNPYTQQVFHVSESHIDILKHMEPSEINQARRYKVLLQTGDETLDYRLAEKRYAGGDLVIEAGGDHSFVNYAQHLPSIFAFLFD